MSRGAKRWLRVLAVVAVTAIALGLRLRAVEQLPIDYDEDDYLRAGQQIAQAIQAGDWRALTELNYRTEHPPLTKLAAGLALSLLPPAEEIPDRPTTAGPASSLPQPHLTAGRLVNALFGTLAVLLVALLNPLAGLMLAVHTFTVKYTSQVMLEALPAFTSAVAVVAYARSERRRKGWLAVSAVALGLTAAGKYMYAIAGVAIAIHWLWQAVRAGEGGWRGVLHRLAPLAAWGLVALATFFLADPYLWPSPAERLSASILYHGEYAQSAAVQEANYPFWQPLVWLFQSVPWHPGVFLVLADALIALLALFGLRSTWASPGKRVYVVWLLVSLLFLFVWPTKWPQYILMLTVPLALVAAEGFRAGVWEPISRAVRRPRRRPATVGPRPRREWGRQIRRALPWLLPGAVILGLIALYPLIYQVGIALTDFNATSIKDGVNGGIWREVRAGLSGQTEAVEVNIFNFSRATSKEVHYAGLMPFLQLVFGASADLIVFEALWTVLSVSLQTALGVAAAWLLHQRGVRLRAWWQTLFILPWALPEFVGALVWMQVFDPRYGSFFLGTSFPDTPGYGLAQSLGQWQENPNAALVVLLVSSIWLGFPLIMLAATAGLNMIPGEVYDAAALDGAGIRHEFRYITWPLLLPLLAPALIIRGIAAFNQFYLFYVLGPPFPLTTLASLSYFVFGETGKYATSAVINLLTVLLLVFFLLWFNRWSRAGEGVSYV